MVAILKERERTFTVQEYLRIEREADYKSEYYHGRIYAMAGASPAHSLITANLGGELRSRIKGSGCFVYSSDLKVRSTVRGLFTYPDVTVVCGDLAFHDDRRDIATNPTVVVEVLSPSTEDIDRGWKWTEYQKIDTLRAYLLVRQDRVQVEHYARRSAGAWTITILSDLKDAVRLDNPKCEIPLSEIYSGVDFSLAEISPEGDS